MINKYSGNKYSGAIVGQKYSGYIFSQVDLFAFLQFCTFCGIIFAKCRSGYI